MLHRQGNKDMGIIKEYIEKQREILKDEEIVNLRCNLKSWRDKFYAHTDMDFLNDEELLREQHKINIKDFQKLIDFAKHTSQRLYSLINSESIGCDLKFQCDKEFELLMKILEDHKRIYENIYDDI